MKREVKLTLIIALLLSALVGHAQEREDTTTIERSPILVDSMAADTVASAPRKLGVVRRTVRGFDRLNDDYIEQ